MSEFATTIRQARDLGVSTRFLRTIARELLSTHPSNTAPVRPIDGEKKDARNLIGLSGQALVNAFN